MPASDGTVLTQLVPAQVLTLKETTMSTVIEDVIKRWTAKRKTALVLGIIQGKSTISDASRAFDLNPSEVEQWVDEGTRGMENALRTEPLEVKEQYEKQLRELQESYGEAMLELRARKSWRPCWATRTRNDPRRIIYYRSTKAAPKVQEHFLKPIKAMLEKNPSFGCRTVARLLGFNMSTVHRIFQLKGWQVHKRPVGFGPRIPALPSVAKAPHGRWAPDLCRVWAGRDGWASQALVIDCYSRSGRSKT